MVDQSGVPEYLGKHGQQLWRSVVSELRLGPTAREELAAACILADRGHEARAQLADVPLCQLDRFGQGKLDPRAAVERASFAEAARILARLRAAAGVERLGRVGPAEAELYGIGADLLD